MTTSTGKIATAGTREGLLGLITRYYCGSLISIVGDVEPYQVHNRNGIIPAVEVVTKKGRWIFQQRKGIA